LAEAGIREIDLATEVHCAVLRKAASMGIAYVFCEMPQITSGPERTLIADTLSNHPTARKLQQGDPVLLELGAHTEGYWADITRAAVVGEPTPLLRRLHQAVLDAQAAAIASYVPGESTGEQLCQASWKAMREAGFEQGITHFLGHGLGFAYHEDRPTLGPGELRPLLPGQVTSIEPGLYWREGSRPVGGIRVEENVVWGSRAGEAEILSDYYRGLDPVAAEF
jgi:Xaa-Pro aminopeptidase